MEEDDPNFNGVSGNVLLKCFLFTAGLQRACLSGYGKVLSKVFLLLSFPSRPSRLDPNGKSIQKWLKALLLLNKVKVFILLMNDY
jgi:hypothetical protein